MPKLEQMKMFAELTEYAKVEDASVKRFLSINFMEEAGHIIDVTRPLASLFLAALNKANRDFIKKSAASCIYDMQHKLWIGPTTDAIGLAYVRGNEVNYQGDLDVTPGVAVNTSTGRLQRDSLGNFVITTTGPRVVMINGQHRAYAIAVTGLTQRILILVGASLEAREVIDNGEARKTVDQITMAGVPEARRQDGIAKAITYVQTRDERSGKRAVRKLSPPAIQAVVKDWQDDIEWTLLAVPASLKLGTPQIAAAFTIAYRAVKTDAVALQRLIEATKGLLNGASPDSPIMMFRDFLLKDTGKKLRKRIPGYIPTLQTLVALSHVIQDEPITRKRAIFEGEDGFNYFEGLLMQGFVNASNEAETVVSPTPPKQLPAVSPSHRTRERGPTASV